MVRVVQPVLVRVAQAAQAVRLRGTLVHLRRLAALVGLLPQPLHLLAAQVVQALILAGLVARGHLQLLSTTLLVAVAVAVLLALTALAARVG